MNSASLTANLKNALQQLLEALDLKQIRYALIGGLATGYRSQPRFTKDIDVLLEVPQLVLPGLLDDLRTRGFDFDADATIRAWIQEHMVVLSCNGVRVDWLKPVLPCYQRILAESRSEHWQERLVSMASAEGLILMKLLAFRGQDQIDIESLLAANQGALDLAWVRHEWTTVADGDDARWRWFESKAAEIER